MEREIFLSFKNERIRGWSETLPLPLHLEAGGIWPGRTSSSSTEDEGGREVCVESAAVREEGGIDGRQPRKEGGVTDSHHVRMFYLELLLL